MLLVCTPVFSVSSSVARIEQNIQSRKKIFLFGFAYIQYFILKLWNMIFSSDLLTDCLWRVVVRREGGVVLKHFLKISLIFIEQLGGKKNMIK